VAAAAPFSAFGVDGVVLINQANAMAGSVTPGDTAGFPVTISQPGSYKLSSNLTITDPTETGILITADNVTVDLNGFTIQGPNVCDGHGNVATTTCTISNTTSVGINAGEHIGIKVLNGSIRGMGFEGIISVGDIHVEGINASLNSSGIQATGVIIHNIANYNLFIGFNGGGIFRENEANGNSIGFLAGLGLEGVVVNNTANFNATYGFFGQTGTTVVSGNSAKNNGTVNILVECPGSITGNSGSITFNGSSAGCVVADNSN
jgi:hypothetical protein